MRKLGGTRTKLAWVAAVVGILTFFLPVVIITTPVFGSLQWSPLNIVTRAMGSSRDHDSPSLGDIAKQVKSAYERSGYPPRRSPSAPHKSVPLGVEIAPLIPVEISLTYLFLAIVLVALLTRVSSIVSVFAFLGMLTGVVALVSTFLFNNAIQQTLAPDTPSARANPFHGLIQALAQTIQISPGLGLYVLVVAVVGLFLVARASSLDRVRVMPREAR